MISFKQYLAEVFDSPLPWRRDGTRDSTLAKTHQFAFTSGGDDFKVKISAEPGSGGVKWYEISLYANGSTDLTGRNNQPFKIYATLIDIVNAFFKGHKLQQGDRVYMISADIATGNIYKRFAKEFAKRHNGNAKTVLGDNANWVVTIR